MPQKSEENNSQTQYQFRSIDSRRQRLIGQDKNNLALPEVVPGNKHPQISKMSSESEEFCGNEITATFGSPAAVDLRHF